jgi:uncharacterized protein (TIGR01777 family)
MVVLIAGGTGFIGKATEQAFLAHGFKSLVLSRFPTKPNHILWNPSAPFKGDDRLSEVTHVVNLMGESIATKRWTESRKIALTQSRVETTHYLFDLCKEHCPKLTSYIGISGVNAYGYSNTITRDESDAFGTDFLSQLIQKWETAHRDFEFLPSFHMIRLGMVLSNKGGAYESLSPLLKKGLGAVPGSGEQYVPWIHLDDVSNLICFLSQQPQKSVVHGVAGCCTQRELMVAMATSLQRKIRLPNLPAFALQLILGERSELLTKSLMVSTQKIYALPFELEFKEMTDTLFKQ